MYDLGGKAVGCGNLDKIGILFRNLSLEFLKLHMIDLPRFPWSGCLAFQFFLDSSLVVFNIYGHFITPV